MSNNNKPLPKLMQDLEDIMAEQRRPHNEAVMTLVAGVILALALMSLFDVTGLAWFAGLLIPLLFVVRAFLWPMMGVTAITMVVWLV